MAYITVDVDLDQILPEFDSCDVIEYIYYNYDNNEVFNQYDYEDIRKFLIEEIGDVVIADIDTLRDLLDPTSNPLLLKEFIQEIFNKQRNIK